MEHNYEIWQLTSFGPGEPPQPFSLIAKDSSFEKIYDKYQQAVESIPCVVTCSKSNQIIINYGDTKEYIFEGSSTGNAVYKRKRSDFADKELIFEI